MNYLELATTTITRFQSQFTFLWCIELKRGPEIYRWDSRRKWILSCVAFGSVQMLFDGDNVAMVCLADSIEYGIATFQSAT
mmetsp:Transcript_37759/g.76832  ORF Transcript_37759/g.76832 Transcript_37759/m.76832 type:complete len:81 (-) Transcript_37759:162-404(-)